MILSVATERKKRELAELGRGLVDLYQDPLVAISQSSEGANHVKEGVDSTPPKTIYYEH